MLVLHVTAEVASCLYAAAAALLNSLLSVTAWHTELAGHLRCRCVHRLLKGFAVAIKHGLVGCCDVIYYCKLTIAPVAWALLPSFVPFTK